jgi:hypothetical protein
MATKAEVYEFEDIRSFLVRRSWLAGGRRLSQEEYEGIKARTLKLDKRRAAYLRAFAEGWIAGRS